MLRDYSGDREALGRVEHFFLVLADVPQLTGRLQALEATQQFDPLWETLSDEEREAGRVRATAWEVIAAANRPPADGPLQGRVARLESITDSRAYHKIKLWGSPQAP